MPRPAQRSRSFRKKRVNTPGKRSVMHYVKKGPGAPKCGGCGKALHGVARGTPAEIGKLTKSRKRPERPYGGNLCPSCTRDVMKSRNIERWSDV